MKNKSKPYLNFAKAFLVSLLFLTYSCALNCCTISQTSTDKDSSHSIEYLLPRTSFVKIEKSIKLEVCDEDAKKLTKCKTRFIGSSASGFIVKNDEHGSYIVTAAHVCDDSELKAFLRKIKNAEILKKKFEIIDIDKIRYNFAALTYNLEIDVCIGYSYSITKPPVKLSSSVPLEGDVVYNLAAPLGLFDENLIPIMHGHFIGLSDGRALYAVPAVGGSSGSPLFNSNGELIGLIHSVYARFPFITLSPTHKQLVDFITANSNKNEIGAPNLINILRLFK